MRCRSLLLLTLLSLILVVAASSANTKGLTRLHGRRQHRELRQIGRDDDITSTDPDPGPGPPKDDDEKKKKKEEETSELEATEAPTNVPVSAPTALPDVVIAVDSHETVVEEIEEIGEGIGKARIAASAALGLVIVLAGFIGFKYYKDRQGYSTIE
jgi:hypothetical protein